MAVLRHVPVDVSHRVAGDHLASILADYYLPLALHVYSFLLFSSHKLLHLGCDALLVSNNRAEFISYSGG